jgi:hypothetical protein
MTIPMTSEYVEISHFEAGKLIVRVGVKGMIVAPDSSSFEFMLRNGKSLILYIGDNKNDPVWEINK